ncbi:hypothetical protein [Natronococcus sp.]|uniref:hypothetical protein n=1 Tax=Natronococcus sp. TaxID=35747 RepID=UPI0025D810D9|nr:hypothetical protein [Natronococcus sp.]
MYNASRGIHYTAPPGPEDENESESTPAEAAEPETPASADDASSPAETGLAADD